MTPQCEALNTAFIQSEQKVSEGLLKKKMLVKNAYYGKVPDGGQFPLRSGTRIKGQRLGRIVPPQCQSWTPVEDALCETNACEDEAEVISNGSSDFYFSLVKFALKTDWLCLDSLALRENPEEEVAHLEDGLRKASRYTHEEFRRSRYLYFCHNKMLTVLLEDGDTGLPASEDVESCDGSEHLNNGWIFESLANGEMDQCHVRACVDPEKLGLIGCLSLDNLDYATETLDLEDEVYMDSTALYDVLLSGKRVANELALAEDAKMHNAAAYGGYNMLDLQQTYGTERVIRNYSLRADCHAMRFYPDTDFNTALLAGEGYAFDLNDPNTWPRFVRVFPYRKVAGSVAGIDHRTNRLYMNAPFGISTIMNKRVMEVMSFPSVSGFGSATKASPTSFEGIAKWHNPDWPCNEDRNKGFWKMHFRMAAKEIFPDEGFAWFHRINRSVSLKGSTCRVPANTALSEITPYCYIGTEGEDEGIGGNRVNEIL